MTPGDLEPHIVTLLEEGDGPVLMRLVRGHVDPQLFVDACEWGYEDVSEQGARVEDVEHCHVRTMPRPEWGYGMREWMRSQPGHGAFRVTLIDIHALRQRAAEARRGSD